MYVGTAIGALLGYLALGTAGALAIVGAIVAAICYHAWAKATTQGVGPDWRRWSLAESPRTPGSSRIGAVGDPSAERNIRR